MQFDADYVLAKYCREAGGLQYVHYPAPGAQRLLVTFAALSPSGLEFNRLRDFWSESETWTDTAFLFFRDATKRWYQDPAAWSALMDIIRQEGEGKKMFLCGSSMGAHAALMCSFKLPVFAVMVTGACWPNDVRPVDFLLWSEACPALAACYLEGRGPWQDQQVLSYVTEMYRRKGGLCLFHSLPDSGEHRGINLWDREFTLGLMDMFEQWRVPQ